MARLDSPDDIDVLAPLIPHHKVSAASNNATNVANESAMLMFYVFGNLNANFRYWKFYDKATAPDPTTDTPVLVVPMPGGAAGHICLPAPIDFALGLGYVLVTGIADTNNTAVAANEIVVSLGYS